jgi:arylformamidase
MIDISVPLWNGMDVWENDPEFSREVLLAAEKDGVTLSRLSFSAHAGTHVDAPCHFLAGGKGVDEISLDTCCGPCQVIEIPDSILVDNMIPGSAIEGRIQRPRVLFKTSNSKKAGKFRKDMIAISLDAAKVLTSSAVGVKLVGVDGLSVEAYGSDGRVHRELLGHDLVLLETLDLTNATEGFYELMSLPIKVKNGDGAPVRAVLRMCV